MPCETRTAPRPSPDGPGAVTEPKTRAGSGNGTGTETGPGVRGRAATDTGTTADDPGLDRVLYRGPGIDIGLFDCPVHHPRFRDTGPARGDLLVFPRHAVQIDHGRGPVVAGRNVVMLYNRGQQYRREALSAYGDQSIWLRFARETVVEALAAAGKAALASERRPFTLASLPCPAASFLAQRRLARSLLEAGDPAGFEEIPELALGLLADAVDRMPEASGGPGDDLTARRHARLAVHQYLLQLRLRAAMDQLIDAPRRRLTDLALDLGFATPSHFASTFRRQFGISPSQFVQPPR